LPNFDIRISYAVPRAGRPSAVSLRKWAAAALQSHAQQGASLAICLVDGEKGRALNRLYRHKDYATNVLSFPADLPECIPVPLLGDIVLCAPIIEREACEQGKTAKAHYAHLTVHGVLHLLGWDHENDDQARAMEQQEREILARLGYADPYADLSLHLNL